LVDAVERGELDEQQGIDAQLARLLHSDRARHKLTNFVSGWLEVDGLPRKAKDGQVFDLGDDLRAAMLGETQQLFLDTFYSRGDVGALFTAEHTFINSALREFYGFGSASSESFERTELPDGTRPLGLLGHAAFLTEHALSDDSSPVQRGVAVLERLLCRELPPVPENLDTNLDVTTQFSNNRERYEEHSNNDACASCHRTIDPVGFAFEAYDGFGRPRTADARGELQTADGPLALDGIDSLSQHLAESEVVQSCFARYYGYFATGREGWAEFECQRDAVRAEASEQGFALQGVVEAVVRAPHFTRRVQDK
jgi:hypothetical protein